MNLINYNGQLIPSDQALFSAKDRMIRYGDGLFESIRIFKGKIPFWEDHFKRLLRGIEWLHFPLPKHYNTAFFQNEIYKLIGRSTNARVRLTVYREAEGLYCPQAAKSLFLIEALPLENDNYTWPNQGLDVGIAQTAKVLSHPLSGLKTHNSLPYILAAIEKKKRALDDCLILNENGAIAEASSANLFCIQNTQLWTTDQQQGAIEGVMQQQIISIAKQLGIPVFRRSIFPTHLHRASEVFLCNAIQGIRWVQSFGTNNYDCQKSRQIFRALVKKVEENQ
ncbi:MAG: aminotransferase class IV [Bacteroidota bacterium]